MPAGIRKLSSRRLTLYTDLPAEQSVDELPAVFDLAFPQWCAYFKIDPRQHDDWRMTGYLMKDKVRFEAAGMLPADLPAFLNGYTRQSEFWLYDQTSPLLSAASAAARGDARRHVHAARQRRAAVVCRGNGGAIGHAPLGRRAVDAELFSGPAARSAETGADRDRRNGICRASAMRLTDVLNLGPYAHFEGRAVCLELGGGGVSRQPSTLPRAIPPLAEVRQRRGFQPPLRGDFSSDGAQMAEEWQVFISDIAYGYDFSPHSDRFPPGVKLPPRGAKLTVAADRGWQNTGVRLEAGKTYDLQATGRYQVGKEPRVLWSEPSGVSIRYVRGKPLGMLLAAVRPDDARAHEAR